MVGDHWGRKSALVSIRPKPAENQMAVRVSVTKRGGRLTSACLMAVRKSMQGFLGNHRCKGWEWRRIRLQTASPVTLWQMWGFAPPKGAKEKRLLNKGPTAKLAVQCPQPCSSEPKKGSSRCLTTGIWGFSWQRKTIKCGGWIFLRFTFPSLAVILLSLKPLLLYWYFSLPSAFSPFTD